MKRKTLVIIGFFVASLCIPALAEDNRFIVKAGTQPDAPVQVQGCDADYYKRYEDTRTVPPSDQLFLLVGVKFKNVSEKTATAIKFRFVLGDPFGDPAEPLYGLNEGTYSPGVLIQPAIGMNGYPKPDSPGLFHITTADTTASELTCSVQSVRFDDGTIWNAP